MCIGRHIVPRRTVDGCCAVQRECWQMLQTQSGRPVGVRENGFEWALGAALLIPSHFTICRAWHLYNIAKPIHVDPPPSYPRRTRAS